MTPAFVPQSRDYGGQADRGADGAAASISEGLREAAFYAESVCCSHGGLAKAFGAASRRGLGRRSLDQSWLRVRNFDMAAAVERLAQEALALSDEERAELARKLLVSLEGPPDEGVRAAWDHEIAKRVDRIREGTAKGRSAEEVSRDIRARYE